MIEGDRVHAKTTRKFDWDVVEPRVVRAMLRHVFTEGQQGEDIERLKRLSDEKVAAQAARTLGRPPAKRHFTKAMVRVLLDAWVPSAPGELTLELASKVQAGLSGPARTQPLRSKQARIDFLRGRNVTENLVANVRTMFLAAHKTDQPVSTKSGPSAHRAGSALIVGEAHVSERPVFPHHALVHQRLEELTGRKQRLQGRVVLPTGAGKTDALGRWLLQKMAADPDLRVLWISHQQELLSQAVQRLQSLGAELAKGFVRKAREIHGAGSLSSTLAEHDLDFAAITFQSLVNVMKQPANPLADFLKRPTWVVVDEAHHAGAPVFHEAMTTLLKRDTVLGLIGLTATPYPTSAHANFRFGRLFETEIFRLDANDLTAQGILAVPVLHTVHTGMRIELSPQEQRRAISNDYSPVVLDELNSAERNNLVLESWSDSATTWGKTLLFASNIAHADDLTDLFQAAGHPVRVIHSQIDEPRIEVLDWFRKQTQPCVLVSVGMLTEGVDLPDAETAFLSRPTTSRILMQQMIGRVLRGPASNGKAEANIVYFADEWTNFEDTLEPGSIVRFPPRNGPARDATPSYPSVILDDEDEEIDPGVADEVEKAVDRSGRMLEKATGPRVEALLNTTTLVGYYRLPARTVPVFEHQAEVFQEFLDHVTRKTIDGSSLSAFEDVALPHPTAGALLELKEYARANRAAPPFVDLRASLGPARAADAVLAAGALTNEQRSTLIAEHYASSIARFAYRSLWHFEEAVDAELRERNRIRSAPSAFVPEKMARPGPEKLRKLPSFDRDLRPIVADCLEAASHLLPPEHAHRLDAPPPVEWTRRPQGTAWAHWTYRVDRSGTLKQAIKVNSILRTRPSIVSDAALGFLIYHELLHHLLVGQGHDDEFRQLEALWPEAAVLNAEFDTLHERWDVRPSRYLRG